MGTGVLLGTVGAFTILFRTLNRFGRGLYFKFENQVRQKGLEKFSKINFEPISHLNLNKLAKGKIKVNIKEAEDCKRAQV